MRSYFNYFIYLSFIFLVIWLFKSEYMIIPKIKSYFIFSGSLLMLFLAFIFEAFLWKNILQKSNYPININQSIASVGFSVFGKYIPGKVWMVIGKAAYLSEKSNLPIGKLSFLSLQMQFIQSWVGLVFGALGLLLIDGVTLFSWAIILLWS